MTDASINTQVQDGEAQFGDFVALLKPRVMSLVVFTAAVGLIAAPDKTRTEMLGRIKSLTALDGADLK